MHWPLPWVKELLAMWGFLRLRKPWHQNVELVLPQRGKTSRQRNSSKSPQAYVISYDHMSYIYLTVLYWYEQSDKNHFCGPYSTARPDNLTKQNKQKHSTLFLKSCFKTSQSICFIPLRNCLCPCSL